MRHLVLLAAVYALIAALVLPSSLLAQDADPAAPDTPAAETNPAEQAPAAPAEPAEPAPTPEPPAAPPEQPAAAPERPPAAPEEPVAAPAPPDKPARERKNASAKAAASGSVTIADFQFSPAQITIDQGDTVTWSNNGPTPHSATAPDGSFDTGIFPAGESRSHTFSEAGTYAYICTPHPQMHGTVVVRASQTGGDTPDSSTDGTGSGDTTGGGSPGAEAAQGDDGPALPSTGADARALLILGALMLLLGAAVHRRARAEQQRPAGRVGW
jgi:LPXTG-motif cell wall-anchored protein